MEIKITVTTVYEKKLPPLASAKDLSLLAGEVICRNDEKFLWSKKGGDQAS
jgi:hypothetical protein